MNFWQRAVTDWMFCDSHCFQNLVWLNKEPISSTSAVTFTEFYGNFFTDPAGDFWAPTLGRVQSWISAGLIAPVWERTGHIFVLVSSTNHLVLDFSRLFNELFFNSHNMWNLNNIKNTFFFIIPLPVITAVGEHFDVCHHLLLEMKIIPHATHTNLMKRSP